MSSGAGMEVILMNLWMFLPLCYLSHILWPGDRYVGV
jgi:hypothetical protein